MLFFGHKFLDSDSFYHVLSIDAILKTPPSATIYIEFSEANLEIMEHAKENSVPFALEVASITELLYANHLGARYIITPQELAKTAQKLAEHYLFDAKVLVQIEDESFIEEMAFLGVDGVIFPEAIIRTNA